MYKLMYLAAFLMIKNCNYSEICFVCTGKLSFKIMFFTDTPNKKSKFHVRVKDGTSLSKKILLFLFVFNYLKISEINYNVLFSKMMR